MTDLPPQKFLVFNYVTTRVEETLNAPDFGDPNQGVQQAASNAYTGSVAGAASLSSATPSTPSVSTLAGPAAELSTAAQNSTCITEEQRAQILSSLGGLGNVGQLPNTLNLMHGHAQSVLNNTTRTFDALDTQFQPQSAGSPNRCVSLSDFIGSIQGKFNEGLAAITAGLNRVTNSLVSLPATLLSDFSGSMTSLTAAINSCDAALIESLIPQLNTISSNVFGSLGSRVQSLITEIGNKVTDIQTAIITEINNVRDALNRMVNNTFRLVVPRVSPCISTVLQQSNENFNPIRVPANLIPDQIIL